MTAFEKQQAQINLLKNVKTLLEQNDLFICKSNTFEALDDLIKQLENTQVLKMRQHFPTCYGIPKSKQIEFAKQEFAIRFAHYLVDNDYVKVEHIGVDQPSSSDVYETTLSFIKNEVTGNEISFN